MFTNDYDLSFLPKWEKHHLEKKFQICRQENEKTKQRNVLYLNQVWKFFSFPHSLCISFLLAIFLASFLACVQYFFSILHFGSIINRNGARNNNNNNRQNYSILETTITTTKQNKIQKRPKRKWQLQQ